MSQSSDPLAIVYAADEHLAIRAGGDFATLVPEWQLLAEGVDGAFVDGSPWELVSPSADFEAGGIAPGHVVRLTKPTTAFRGSGHLLAVDSVSGSSLTLRRIGWAAGAGKPPAPPDGLAGVAFSVPTLGPQVEEASFDLNRRFGIDPRTPGRSPESLLDLRDLRAACVLSVLLTRYLFESRGDRGDFPRKADMLRAELSDLLARLSVRWAIGEPERRTSRFTTRLER